MKLPITKEEMITCESWYHLADYHYIEQNDLPSGIVHCDIGSIKEFFSKIEKFPKRKYIVISSRADFGLHYQEKYPPWKDYAKLAEQLISGNNTNYGYSPITLPATVNSLCNPNDKYSVKCYRYTGSTFNNIPSNVKKWFIANNTINDDERIVSIPFGINGVDGNLECVDAIHNIMSDYNDSYRELDLYLNFQFHTNERLKLYKLYWQSNPKITVESQLPFDQFLQRLLQHNCCLCPAGNGWDCYRTLESLYVGCIPILELNDAMLFYTKLNLPIVFLRSLESATEDLLNNIRQQDMYDDRNQWDLTCVSLSYWKNIIEDCRKLLK
jgi:hypothetical protein